MLSFTGSLKVFVAVEPCDLRRGHNGLLALVGEKLREDIKSGALVAFGCLRFAPAVFTNKRRRLLKILYWDGTGLWLASKRLEQGTFSWPRSAESGALKLKLAPEALAMLTDGIDLRDGAQRPWYERA
jgi:transposase